MSSRSTTLANAVVAAIAAWGSLPAGVTVSRVRSITQLISDLPPETPAVIAVIVPQVEDQSSRGEVAEDVTLGIVLVANCDSLLVAASDPWDALTELLRDFLRTSSTFRNVSVGGSLTAQRKSVSTSVVCDADMMHQAEVFVSVTEATWYLSVGNRS